MLLEQILERNRNYVAGREARPFPPVETLQLAVVACYDPRLDSLLLPALGLASGDAFLFRAAGALVRPAGASLRSLGLAVFMFGVSEILVVGHTSCRMAAFQTSAFIDSFRRRGVPREAFGSEELRDWAGAIPDPRRGVQMSIASILAAPFLPRDVSVWGAVMDDASGRLEVVAQPNEAVAQPARDSPAEGVETEEPIEEQAASGDKPASMPAAGSGADSPLAAAVEEFARTVRSKASWAQELRQLRQELDRPLHPLVKFRMLESFAKRAGTDSREVLQSFERLKRTALAARGGLESKELFQLFQRLSGKP